jgi:hypothetical protein
VWSMGSKMAPATRSPIPRREFPIRDGDGKILTHGEENGEKSIPVGSSGDGDGFMPSVPVPRIPAPLGNTGCSIVEFSPSRPTLAHQRIEYIFKFVTLISSIPTQPPLPQAAATAAVARALCLVRQLLLPMPSSLFVQARFRLHQSRIQPRPYSRSSSPYAPA